VLFTYTPAVLKAVGELLRTLEPLVVDQPLAPADIYQALRQRFRLLGTQGLLGMALAGIDMALWDAHARMREQPLYEVLGGKPKTLAAYGGIGFDGPAGCAEQAADWARRGLRGVKAKIGYPTVDEDLAVIRAMRNAVGPELAIMVDYNQSLTSAEAHNRLAALSQEALEWVEEPVPAQDFRTLGILAQRYGMPLQAGENWWDQNDFSSAHAFGATDRFMPDVMKCGGVSGWCEVAQLAAALDVPLSNHLWPEVSAHLMFASPTAGAKGSWLEYFDWWNPILTHPLELSAGQPLVPDTPGAGVRFNSAAVLKCEV
jgi:mandelate racemase